MLTVKNPIMPGFYPDPSICAVGGDYYLVNSSFAYFPGLPVMHSRDLLHWEQIGNVLDRQSQLPLENAGLSQGLFAPTIRYHKGLFYVICTNVTRGGNFVVTAENPEGPWSEPHFLKDAGGIDPSLFFDEDGKCYYIGTHPNPDGCRYDGDWFIWIQELDLNTWELIGEPKDVWNGAMRGVHWPEGPHLYKIGDYYYILHAEGGTGPEHAVTVCRSKHLWGPYENNFCNPILTHRHLGQDYPVKYVGHADLFKTPAGEWFMTMLAVRPLEGFTTMGRETFLAKVTWEKGWPVVNAGIGKLTDTVEVDLKEWIPEEDPTSYTVRTGRKNCVPGSGRIYDFTGMKELGDEFLLLRNPRDGMVNLRPGEGLFLRAEKISLNEKKAASYLSVRQQHHCFTATTTICVDSLPEKCSAGIAVMQNESFQLRGQLYGDEVNALLVRDGAQESVGRIHITGDEVTLILRVNGLAASLCVKCGEVETPVAEGIDIRSLSTEIAGGFVGCTVGIYAMDQSNLEIEKRVCFKSFSYEV